MKSKHLAATPWELRNDAKEAIALAETVRGKYRKAMLLRAAIELLNKAAELDAAMRSLKARLKRKPRR